MADSAPWLKYQSAPASDGPWTKYQTPKASPPGKENSGIAAMQPGQPIEDEHGPVQDVIDFAKGGVSGAGKLFSDVSTMAQHPIETAKAIPGAVANLAGGAAKAVMHPVDTAQKVGDYLKNVKPREAGEQVGSALAGGAVGKSLGVLGDVVGPALKQLPRATARAASVIPGPVGKIAKDLGTAKPISPTIRDLANKGVVLTPGMRGGKIASAVEQRATSIPLVGDAIKRARGKATEQWNRAELNEAIQDAGGTAIPATRRGRDAIFHAEQEMGKAYDRVLSKMSGNLHSADPAGVTFGQFLDQTKYLASQGLEPSAAKAVATNIDRVMDKFNRSVNGKITGETVKEIQETLRTEIDQLKGGTYQERKAAEALKAVSADMKAMLKRENPKLAVELDNVDRGYAKFKASSKASLYSAKNQGVYTPAQKLQAIKARDKSKDKQRTASGQARGQKEAEAVESVIGNTEPDSGSAGRIATMEAILGGAGIAAHHPLGAAAVMGGPALYSQPVLKALQRRALNKGGPYTPIKSGTAVGAALGVDENGVAQ